MLAWNRHEVAIAQDGLVVRRLLIRLVAIEKLIVKRQAGGMLGHAAHRCIIGAADARYQLGIAKIVIDWLIQINLVRSGPPDTAVVTQGTGSGQIFSQQESMPICSLHQLYEQG